jgi:hypothetical protein
MPSALFMIVQRSGNGNAEDWRGIQWDQSAAAAPWLARAVEGLSTQRLAGA